VRFLKIEPDEVRERYCRVVDVSGFKRLSLKEKLNFDCIFWADGGCTIYRARPFQCRSFPFWSSNLISEEAWQSASLSCPGIGRGVLHSKREIEYWLKKHRSERLIIMDESSPTTP
jgi:Fe-S-cluster containining protein